MNKQRKRLLILLFVVFNVAVIAYTAYSEFGGKSKAELMPHFSGHWALYLLGALACIVILFAAETAKYAFMMRILNEKVSLRAAFETAALGKYYDSITPSGSGGQPFQIYWLHKRGYSDGAASAMPIIGFITMQTGFILLALIMFIGCRSVELEAIRITAYIGLVLYAVFPIVLCAFGLKPKATEKVLSAIIHFLGRLHILKNPDVTMEKLLNKLNGFHTSMHLVYRKNSCVLILLILSLIFQLALSSIPYFVLQAMGGETSYLYILATTVYVYSAASLILTPGNSGAAEGAFYAAFSGAGVSGVFPAMLIWRLFSYYSFLLIGALVYGLNALTSRRKQKEELK